MGVNRPRLTPDTARQWERCRAATTVAEGNGPAGPDRSSAGVRGAVESRRESGIERGGCGD